MRLNNGNCVARWRQMWPKLGSLSVAKGDAHACWLVAPEEKTGPQPDRTRQSVASWTSDFSGARLFGFSKVRKRVANGAIMRLGAGARQDQVVLYCSFTKRLFLRRKRRRKFERWAPTLEGPNERNVNEIRRLMISSLSAGALASETGRPDANIWRATTLM